MMSKDYPYELTQSKQIVSYTNLVVVVVVYVSTCEGI